MAYKQVFNKHVLETIQICDIFRYSYLRYKFLYSLFIKRGKYNSKQFFSANGRMLLNTLFLQGRKLN